MPIVPTNKLPSVANRPVATPFDAARGATPDAFGAGIGKAMIQAGTQMKQRGDATEKIALSLMAEDNTRRAKEIDSAYNADRRDLLFGQDGVYSKRGSMAVDGEATANKKLNDLSKKYISQAQNDSVRKILEASFFQTSEQDKNKMAAFVSKERITANLSASQARQQSAINEAAAAYNDPAVLNKSLATTRAEVFDQARVLGWDAATTKNEEAKAVSLLFSKTIESVLKSGDVSSAVALLKEHRSQISAPIAAQLDRVLENPKLIVQAQEKTDSYTQTGKDFPALITKARKELKGKLRDAVVKRLEYRRVEANSFKQEEQNTIFQDASSAINSGKVILDEWKKTNSADWLKLSSAQQNSLDAAEKNTARRDVYAEHDNQKIVDEFTKKSVVEKAKIDPLSLRSQVTQGTYDKLAATVKAAKSVISKTGSSFTGYSRIEKLLKDMAPTLKIGKESQSTDQAAAAEAVRTHMLSWLEQNTVSGVIPATIDMRNEMLRQLAPATESSSIGNLFGLFADTTTVAEALASGSDARVSQENIPADKLSAITTMFKQRKVETSRNNIEDYYWYYLTGDSKAANELLGTIQGGTADKTVGGGIKEDIMLSEEFKAKAYPDGTYPSVGYGSNLDGRYKPLIEKMGLNYTSVRSGKTKITKEQAQTLFEFGFKGATEDVKHFVPSFPSLSTTKQNALVDMAYTLGRGKFSAFTDVFKAIAVSDWPTVVKHLKQTPWYKNGNKKRRAAVIAAFGEK